ncbi:potassium channel family protein [Candidatus Omnitrophota bacterium]
MRHQTKQILLAFALLISVLIIGTFGYILIENDWSLLDAIYMTVITITTVGFTETNTLSDAGRVFTIILIFCGWTTVAILLSFVTKAIVSKEISGFLGRKNMHKEISNLKNHYIICGYGRIGSFICHDLIDKNIELVVVEIKEDLIKSAERKGLLVLTGNATLDEVLLEAGIKKARGLVATLTEDAHNLFISLAARELNPDIHIISRCEEFGVQKRIRRGGANVVVSPLQVGAKHIADLIVKNTE